MSESPTNGVKCRAHSTRTGLPCQKYAIKGATVCRTHGGAAPQVKAKAEQRLREMVDPMISRLHELAMQTDSPKVAAECVRDALDRAGIGAVVRAKVRASKNRQQQVGSGVTVQIGFLGGNEPPPMEVTTVEAKPTAQVTAQVMPPRVSVGLPRAESE